MSDETGNAIFYTLLLILPLSALFARRLPFGRVAIMSLAWIGIFATGLLIVAIVNRNDWLVSGAHELFYGRDQSVVGEEVRIAMAPDGHFYVRAAINGVETLMLVDSGATDTALSSSAAAAANVKIDDSAVPISVMTANGAVEAHPAVAASLKVGGITATDLRVDVSLELGDMNLLGMNFLSKLKTWRVEGKTLILVPEHQ